MERMNTWLKCFLLIVIVAGVISCSKKASEPIETPTTPSETYVLRLINTDSTKVGNVFIDNMQGKARVRIQIDSSYYNNNILKVNIVETNGSAVTTYAYCNDIDGNTGKSSTYPVYTLNNNSIVDYMPLITSTTKEFRVYNTVGAMVAFSINPTVIIVN